VKFAGVAAVASERADDLAVLAPQGPHLIVGAVGIEQEGLLGSIQKSRSHTEPARNVSDGLHAYRSYGCPRQARVAATALIEALPQWRLPPPDYCALTPPKSRLYAGSETAARSLSALNMFM